MSDPRTDELAANLRAVEERIARACELAGRAREDVTLVVVTKTHPVEDVRRLATLGVTDIGENRDQDAAPKAQACADLPLRWHFVGQLQSNKCRSIARYADVVHSLDRASLVTALGAAAERAGREVTGLVQVALEQRESPDRAVGRGGAAPEDVPALADLVATTPGLRLGGLMAVAPLGADPAPAFALLSELSRSLRVTRPAASIVSAGMSGDLEQAIAAGATHVRVGTAVLGARARLG